MSKHCTHLPPGLASPQPNTMGCEECLQIGGQWVHLRECQACGHVGCCNDSPNHHATVHAGATGHPVIRSFEPGEDWWYCYVDDVAFNVEGAPPAPSHP